MPTHDLELGLNDLQVHNSPGVRMRGGVGIVHIIGPKRERRVGSPKEKQADTGREEAPATQENEDDILNAFIKT